MQLTAFVDAGGTLVDTADVYCDGESERALGHLLTDVVPRSDVLVATKAVGRTGPGPMGRGASRGHLLAALDASLERLGLDYVDLWQLHAWDEATPIEETLAACDLAVSSGRARYIGISNFTGWQTAQAATWQRAWPGRTPLISTQVEYSLLQRGVEREVVPAAEVARPRRARLVAAGPRAADRQVPAQHAVGVPRRLAAVAGVHRRAALGEVRPDRRGRDHRGRGPGHDAAGRRAGLGARPARAWSRRSSAPAPPSSCRPRWTPTACACPRRSAPRWRTCRRRRSAIPSAGPRDDRALGARHGAAGPGLRRLLRRRPLARAWASGRRPSSPPPGSPPRRRHRRPADQAAPRWAGSAPSGCSPASWPRSPPTRWSSCSWARAGGQARRRASPTRSARTPRGGCATTRGRC